MPNILKTLVGRRFGKLIVISREDNDKRGNTCWKCQCDCGKETICNRSNLQSKATRSCGCQHYIRIKKELCKRGHKFTTKTTYIDGRGRRNCGVCRKEWFSKNKKKVSEYQPKYQKKWRLKKITSDPNYKRNVHLKHCYGITHEDYEKMFAAQEGKCAICENSPENGQLLHVDHCHESNKVRKLLCRGCNQGLGHFKDKSELLIKASEYLKEFA